MSLALVMPRIMKASKSGLVILVLCGLILTSLPLLEAIDEGDSCTVKNLPGVCRASSVCEPLLEKYIRSGTLTPNDIPTCSLGTREEIVCCPIEESGPDEPGPRQVVTTTTTTRSTSTTTTTTTTRRLTTSTPSNLDEHSDFFDFQQILNRKTTKRPSETELKSQNPFNSNANMLGFNPSQILTNPSPTRRILDQFQSLGPLGPAPTMDRQPKIINRPQSIRLQQNPRRRPANILMPGPESGNLIHLVNDRLRQQGMNVVPAKEVTTFEMGSTTARPTPAPTIANVDLDPWAPFRFRPSPLDELNTNELPNGNGVAEAFGPDTTTTRTIQPTPTTRVDANPSKERPAVRACRMIEKRDTENALSPHILDGVPVDDGVYPHMAAIAFSNFGTFDYRCGGSLISRRHVLTAAHCVNSEELTPVHVRLGTVNIDQVNAYYQDIKVISNITIHPEYVSSSKYNDIAILELAEDARLNHWIYPACLDTNIVDPPKESKIFVAGWGVMNQTTRRTSKILLRAPLTIVPLDDCNKLFAEFPSSTRFIKDGIINTLLCAADVGQNKKDACQGDSGGPLVLEHDIVNNMYSILGVISSGFGCATKTPGLYTRVASYLDFIESVVWPNNVVENLSNST